MVSLTQPVPKVMTWVHTRNPPDGHGSKLYYVESGCEYGYKEDDGYVWYRINTSYWFGDWIETQDKAMRRIYGGKHRAIYIVREDLLMWIRLKWL